MGKRGRKTYEEFANGVMPVRVIAERMGVSERTVTTDLKNAQRKLKNTPEAFPILLDCLYAVAASEKELLQCGSVECDREYIEKYGWDQGSKG
jgi:DNA-binding CsgD family transcriptional regulator